MEKQLERMEEKLDKVDERLTSIDVTLAKQHISLEIHIKRTNLLEEQVKSITKHVNMVQGFFVILIALGGLALTLKDLF